MKKMIDINNFKAEKKFFIGIDSDGTAFDSMAIKHTDSFIPMFFEVWGLLEHKDEITEIEEYINLYSSLRGINRFPGLLLLFKELKKKGWIDFDFSEFEEFCQSGMKMSNASLAEFMETHKSQCLADVMKWSLGADELFTKGAEGLMPFKGVTEALQKASLNADIVVISSASTEGLKTDWENGGILKFVTCLCGQDAGSKKEQLKKTAFGNYDSDKILMLGDAFGDMDAVKNIDGLFFPIVPKSEEASWVKLFDEALDKFFGGEYAGEYEQCILDGFKKSLPEYNL